MKQERITTSQLAIVVAIAVMGTVVLSVPRTLSIGAENSGWISLMLGWAIGLAGIFLFVRLAERFPQKTIAEYSALVFGRWLGKLVSLSFSAYFILLCALYTRVFAQTIVIPLLPETPISVVLGIFVILLIYESHAGLQSIAQLSQVFIVPIIIAALVIVAGVAPLMDLGRLKPLFQPGPGPILRTALTASTHFGESAVLLVLYPYLTRRSRVLRSGWIGLSTALAILLPVVLGGVAVYGHEQVQRLLFPTLSLARLIRFGGFVEHAEVLFVVLWLFSAFLKVSILFYVSSVALAQTFGIDDYRPLVNVLATIVVLGSLLPENAAMVLELTDVVVSYGWMYEYGLPLIVLLAAVVLRKEDRHDEV